MTKKPNRLRHLDDAIRGACGGSPDRFLEARTLMANAAVVQMIPDGVVKGGSAIKMRFGGAKTRFTQTSTPRRAIPKHTQKPSARRSRRDGGFTGRIVEREPAQPKDVPPEYVMRPFDVKLSYNGKPWCTVPLEVGHNEIGDPTPSTGSALPTQKSSSRRSGSLSPERRP